MPRIQVATVPVFDFGAPISGDPLTTEASRVLKFKVKDQQGGKLTIDVEADDVPLDASVLVSDDGVTWAAATASANGEAISAVTIKPLCHQTFEPVVRAGKDKFFAIGVVGGGRGRATIRECFFNVVKL
jgi:hypothetical protein